MKNKVKNVLIFLILLISIIIVVGSLYYKENFAEQTFESLFYNLKNGTENANTEVVGIAIRQSLGKIIVFLILVYLPIIKLKNKYILDIQFKNKKKSIQIFPLKKSLNKVFYTNVILLMSIIFLLINIGLFDYIREQKNLSTVFEEKYIAKDKVTITFPENKRNLIYIFLESMETSLVSEEEGGGWEYTIIPELAELAKKNINFSNTEKLGGALSVNATTWTVAGMVAQTSGTPLKVSIDANSYSGYGSFLPGVYSLGDILEEEGYNLEVMFGSDSSYGGRKDYFVSHGNYKVFDVNTAIEEGKMAEEDRVWWGFDDDDLFAWAKEEILDLASKDEPFNFIMLTADTHFVDGYLSENVENLYDTQYENIFAYSSKSTYEFIKWIQKQEFYENTTIVVVGDHLGMQTQFYSDHITNKDYIRTVYNVFINSAIPDSNSKNRNFSTMDIFPTVLASTGAEIKGDRIGLGTNLFSGKETLIEEMGFYMFQQELARKSNYYNTYLLQDDYYEMMKEAKVNIE